VIDHVGLNVSDAAASKAFYERALAPLGYTVGSEFEDEEGTHVGFRSPEGRYDFWIAQRGEPTTTAHVSFRVDSRELVDAFHAAALEAGGPDNGPPGLRPQYHDNYYGAFVLDPDGNNVEAVSHSSA
jgi:catechol 2,3-dioxygenase-like lactoylglutathione lyase family enzyme